MLTDPVIAIPPLATAAHAWRPRVPEIFSGAEVRRQTGAYASAVPAPIAAWSPAIAGADLADVEEAVVALAEFDAHALLSLGSDSVVLGPMASVLLRTESASSSQIEQLTTSAGQLALAEIDEGGTANAATVIGNVRAMEAALALADRVDEGAILAMHRELLRDQPGMEDEAGRYRGELVWIGGRDGAGPRGADYIAPQPELVPGAVADLVAFVRRDDLPVLVQAAVAHAQFETIHPFVDGNGRTGRALVQAILRGKGIVRHATVPISAGLLTDVGSYFRALEAFRRGDAGPVVRRFADAARYASFTGRRLVDDLAAELDAAREKLRGVRPQATAWRILPHLIAQPVVNTRHLAGVFGLPDVTVIRALDVLVDRGVLTERTGRARHRVWQNAGVLRVLDEYAKEIRRRPGR
ncbi:Fic family protein [Microbacterium indicum]|uniref:Fic family protein n=1 Tax=Microbacterium indicum TaxID=358100 RepID=UPI0003F62BBF|nr:Fic family protein [Microbacterium indicum]